MHPSSYKKMEGFKNNYLNLKDSLDILDIGSYDASDNSFNYKKILNEKNWNYFGLDLKEGPNVDIVVADPYDWKEIKDQTFDVVISGQAFEHIEFFWLTMEQIDKVLKPGGLCCIIAPSKGPVHGNPVDCYRYKVRGIEALAKYVNFNILESSTDASEESYPWHDSILIAQKPFK